MNVVMQPNPMLTRKMRMLGTRARRSKSVSSFERGAGGDAEVEIAVHVGDGTISRSGNCNAGTDERLTVRIDDLAEECPGLGGSRDRPRQSEEYRQDTRHFQ